MVALNNRKTMGGFGDVATGNNIARTITGSSATKPGNAATPGTNAYRAARSGGFNVPAMYGARDVPAPTTPGGPPTQVGAAPPVSAPSPGTVDYVSPNRGAAAPRSSSSANAPRGGYSGAVSGRVDSIIAQDSPLMQRAATRGFQVANRRGLGNSSMAGQAAQLSVLDAATPIATADAQDTLTREMTADELANRLTTTKMNNDTSVTTAGIGAQASMYGADKSAEVSLKLAEINNRHDLTMQEKDKLAKIELAKMGFTHEGSLADKDIAARYGLADKDIAAREKLAQMGIDAEAEQAALNRAFQTDSQAREFFQQFNLANLDIAARTRIVVTQLEAEAAQKALDRALQEKLGTQEITFRQNELTAKLAAAQQERIATIISDSNGQRMAAYANTLSDPKMPAAARTAVQQSINDQYQSTVNYVQNLYGVGLSNATPGGTPAPAPALGTASTLGTGAQSKDQLTAQYIATKTAITNAKELSPEQKAFQLANIDQGFYADLAKYA